MESPFHEREIGVRGPFDPYQTRESMLKMVDGFLCRTGLLDYAHYFRIGAFLARRPFGKRQVEYLQKAYREEDAQSSISARDTSNEVNESKNLRRQYEYDKLDREGDRGRWRIFWRQKWRVHALVLCCSLGAAIQGWDESAVNGGNVCGLSQLRSPLTNVPAQLYYVKALKVPNKALIGLINSAPYLMCILSCL